MAVTCILFRYFVKNVKAYFTQMKNRSVGLLIQYKYHTSVYQIMSNHQGPYFYARLFDESEEVPFEVNPGN